MSTPSSTALRHLDGNAVAGAMTAMFGTDISDAMGTCRQCLHRAAMGETRAYVDGPGVVLRCGQCDNIVMRWATTSDTTWLEMAGLRSLEMRTRS
jgi:hypothetical protein